MIRQLVPVIAICATPLVALHGQAPTGKTSAAPPRQASSSWSIVRDADGEERSRTLINRTFEFAFRYIDTRPTDLLYVQEVRTTFVRSQEGENGRVRIDAWASFRPDTGYRTQLWTATLSGSAARMLDNYYEVTESGCCGSWDTRTFLLLKTGRPIATFTGGPVWVSGPDVGEPRAAEPLGIVFLSSQGAGSSAALRSDSLAFGELLFLQGDSVTSRIVLTGTTSDAAPWATVEFTVVAGRDSTAEGHLWIPKGVPAVVRITSEAWPPITVPLRRRGLTLQGASLPATVRARAIQ